MEKHFHRKTVVFLECVSSYINKYYWERRKVAIVKCDENVVKEISSLRAYNMLLGRQTSI